MTTALILIALCLLAMTWLYRSIRYSLRVEAAMDDWRDCLTLVATCQRCGVGGCNRDDAETELVRRYGNRVAREAIKRVAP